MKKARANTNDYWDKKLLEVEEKDPNRWRHTGYKKMYIEGESSSESDRESFRYNRVHSFDFFSHFNNIIIFYTKMHTLFVMNVCKS